MAIFFTGLGKLAALFFQGGLFVWIVIAAFFEWLVAVFPNLCKYNASCAGQVSLYVGAFILTPLNWWQCLIFMLLPIPIGLTILGLCAFYLVIFTFAQSVVFL